MMVELFSSAPAMAANRPTRPSVRLMLPSTVSSPPSTVHRPPNCVHSCHSKLSCVPPSPLSLAVVPLLSMSLPSTAAAPMSRSHAPFPGSVVPLSAGRRRSNRRQHGGRSRGRGPLMALRRCSASDRNRAEKMRLDTDLAMGSNHGQDGGSWLMEVAVA